MAGDRPGAEQVDVGEIQLRLGVEVFVAEVAATDDGHAAVGQPELVVHAPVLPGQVQQAAESTGDAVAAAEMQRTEQADLDVRVGGQRGDLAVAAVAGGVVEQEADAHAAVGGLQQLHGEQPRAEAVVGDVVLQVEAALGVADQFGADGEGLVAVGQQTEAGLPGRMTPGRGLHGRAEPGALGRQGCAGLPRNLARAAGQAEQGQQDEDAHIDPPEKR